jgi:hypothetical protein
MKAASPGIAGSARTRPARLYGRLSEWLRRNFYFAMALAIVAVVIYGFSQTFENSLAHPPYPRPWILYVHATVFPLWVLLFVTQTALVRNRNVKLHRRIGVFGLVLGSAIPVVALVTAIIMDRLHIAHGEQNGFFPPFMIVHLNDSTAFLILFGLAAILRAKSAFHGRLMFVATCILTDAGFARFPAFILPNFAITLAIAYACVDALILCGVARDWLVDKRVHAVYRWALPALVIGQVFTTTLFATAPPWWLAISHAIIGA